MYLENIYAMLTAEGVCTSHLTSAEFWKMPLYLRNGSIAVIDDILVVKLNEE